MSKSIDEYNQKLSECHAYGLCATGDPYSFPCKNCPALKNNTAEENTECQKVIPGTFIMCGEGIGNERQYCSKSCWDKAGRE